MSEIRDQMKDFFLRWEDSGQSLRAFSQQEGVAYSKVMYWRRRVRGEGEAKETRSKKGGALIPVRIVPERSWDTVFRVQVRGGVEIAVPAGFDSGELTRLVRCLHSC